MTETYNTSHPSSYQTQSWINRGVRVHWRVYLIVNCFLMALNALIGFYYYPWFLWPLMSWGIGIAIHSSVVYITHRFQRNSERGFFIHLAVFLTLSIYLFFVNLLTGFWYFWFLWPVAAMAIGIGEHFVAYQYIRGQEMQRPTSPHHTLWYPGVVCLFLVFVDFFSDGWLDWSWWPTISIMLIALFVVSVVIKQRMKHLHTYPSTHPSTQRSPVEHQTQENVSQPSERSPNRRFCPRCGEVLQSTHPFCEFCGMKLQ